MKSIKKKTGANFLLFVANCGKILFYISILIYFFRYETIIRFDVYSCLDCNCRKRITVYCATVQCSGDGQTRRNTSGWDPSHTPAIFGRRWESSAWFGRWPSKQGQGCCSNQFLFNTLVGRVIKDSARKQISITIIKSKKKSLTLLNYLNTVRAPL